MKQKQHQRSAAAEILVLGWDTESTSNDCLRAFCGPLSTQWHPTWEAVLVEVRKLAGRGGAQ
jgi:hypothetical protein